MQLSYLLDTNICIYIIKQKPEQVLKRCEALTVGAVAMSTMTYGELLYGARKSQQRDKSLQNLEALAHAIPPLPLATDVADYYGEIRALLERRGTPIGNNDLWIAAHALSLKITLVTNNENEFCRIPELAVENWCDQPVE